MIARVAVGTPACSQALRRSARGIPQGALGLNGWARCVHIPGQDDPLASGGVRLVFKGIAAVHDQSAWSRAVVKNRLSPSNFNPSGITRSAFANMPSPETMT